MDAPSFDGYQDPKEYLDWESGMDYFFEWYDMTESRKIRFAHMKLLGQAKIYWHNIQVLIENNRHKPIRTWTEMKEKL